MKNNGWKLIFAVFMVMILFAGCGQKNTASQQKCKDTGLKFMSMGEYDKAAEAFNKALSYANHGVSSQEIDICYYKAAALYGAGDFEGAQKTYSALIKYDKDNSDAYFLRGCIYANEHQLDHALSDFKKAVELDEKNYDMYIQIYNQLDALDYRDEGMGFLNMALEVDGNKANDDMQRGRIYLMLEQYDAAEKALQKAIDKNLGEAKVYMAQVYLAKDDTASAKKILAEYQKSGKITAAGYNLIGNIQMQQKEYKKAYSYYKKGLALNDESCQKDLMKNEVCALEYLGKFDEAKEKLAAYLEKYPADQDAIREQTFLATR